MLALFPKLPKSQKPLKIDVFISPLWFDTSPHGIPANIRIKLTLQKPRVIGLHIHPHSMSLTSFKYSWLPPKMHVFWNIQGHWFGTNRKRVYTHLLLLVISSNFGPVLPRFRDIAGFLLKTATPCYPCFDGVPLGLYCRCWGSEEQRPYKLFNLFNRVITFEVTQLIWPWYLSVTEGRTDKQTDDLP